MTLTTDHGDVVALPDAPPAPRFAALRALAVAETRLLLRNRVAVLNAVLMPVLLVLLYAAVGIEGLDLADVVPLALLAMGLVFVVYYTLVTAVVARRESRVLQRLRTGEAGEGTILTGLALPFGVIVAAETIAALAFSVVVLGGGAPAHPALVAAAIVLSIPAWSLLGIASTSFTRSVEHAQISTLPLITVALLGSGMTVPLGFLPPFLSHLASLTPLHPVVTLMRLGTAGIGVDGVAVTGAQAWSAAVAPIVVLLAWSALGAWWVARRLQWEPRR